MNKRFWIFGFLCLSAIGLTACAETPKEKIVVDRSKGLSEEYIIPEEKNKIPKDLQIPEYWKEEIKKSEDFITLAADLKTEIPTIYNTPVYSYKMLSMTDEELKRLCDYFSQGKPLYQETPKTKDELKALKEQIQKRSGIWGGYTGMGAGQDIYEKIEMTEELAENAPEEVPAHNDIEPKLTSPYQMEEEYIRGETAWGWTQYYYDTDRSIGFTARVDTGEKTDPLIRAVNYDKNVGSTTKFLYTKGCFVDESYIDKKQQSVAAYGSAQKNYINYLQETMDSKEFGEFTQDMAIEEANKLLKDLSVQDFAMAECEKAIGYAHLESISGLTEESEPICPAYALSFYRKAGDVIGYNIPMQPPAEDGMPETVYAPLFPCDRIYIVVSEEGIQRFEWTGMSQRTGVVAENTKLLSFEQIKERVAEHLLYERMAIGGESSKEEGILYTYDVKDVQLRAANVNAFEDPSSVWMIPVWVFTVKATSRWKDSSFEFVDNDVVLSAIDGGYITPGFN